MFDFRHLDAIWLHKYFQSFEETNVLYSTKQAVGGRPPRYVPASVPLGTEVARAAEQTAT